MINPWANSRRLWTYQLLVATLGLSGLTSADLCEYSALWRFKVFSSIDNRWTGDIDAFIPELRHLYCTKAQLNHSQNGLIELCSWTMFVMDKNFHLYCLNICSSYSKYPTRYGFILRSSDTFFTIPSTGSCTTPSKKVPEVVRLPLKGMLYTATLSAVWTDGLNKIAGVVIRRGIIHLASGGSVPGIWEKNCWLKKRKSSRILFS